MTQDTVLDHIQVYPGRSASQLAKLIDMSCDNLASMLSKMVAANLVRREPGVGPRGGYGYYVVAKRVRSGPSVWDHLLNDSE